MCREDNVPLNFFSWHCYTADPTDSSRASAAVRRLLDEGLHRDREPPERVELPAREHLGADRQVGHAGRPAAVLRRDGGAQGAAFVAAALLELQDAPVDVCNFFHGELGGFGIFTEQGVPLKAYQALRAVPRTRRDPAARRGPRGRRGQARVRRRPERRRSGGVASSSATSATRDRRSF